MQKTRLTAKAVQDYAVRHGFQTDSYNGDVKVWVGPGRRSFFEGRELFRGSPREALAFMQGYYAALNKEDA